jgi:hypothetical protein
MLEGYEDLWVPEGGFHYCNWRFSGRILTCCHEAARKNL